MTKVEFPASLMDAIRIALPDFSGCPSDLVGRKFHMLFYTLNEDTVNPREYDRQEMVGTILGVHLDQSAFSLVFTVSNLMCGIDAIRSVDFSPTGKKWLVDFDGGNVNFADDQPSIFTLE